MNSGGATSARGNESVRGAAGSMIGGANPKVSIRGGAPSNTARGGESQQKPTIRGGGGRNLSLNLNGLQNSTAEKESPKASEPSN